jgi:hypothetical protein
LQTLIYPQTRRCLPGMRGQPKQKFSILSIGSQPKGVQITYRRPILAFGNSDGDLAMLQYTAASTGARLALLLHDDDGDREYAYDRDFRLSPLREALDEVPKMNGGHIVSMKQDFKQVFGFG